MACLRSLMRLKISDWLSKSASCRSLIASSVFFASGYCAFFDSQPVVLSWFIG